jgi:hypothetical protein
MNALGANDRNPSRSRANARARLPSGLAAAAMNGFIRLEDQAESA